MTSNTPKPVDSLTLSIYSSDRIITLTDRYNEISTFIENQFGGVPGWISIVLEKDFFIEADGCTIVIEDNRASQYTKYMQRGNRVQVLLNDKPNFDGFIFDYKLEYSRHQNGTRLTLQCKDLLEWMAQGSIPPNMFQSGTGSLTNYHFPPNTTLLYALRTIVEVFRLGLLYQGINIPNLYVSVYDNNDQHNPNIAYNTNPNSSNSPHKVNVNALDLASGFGAGLRIAGKKAGIYSKSWNKAINRLNTPQKGESYLSMMKRLTKLTGANLKMAPGRGDTILVQAPTYDRTIESPFQIIHYLNSPNNQNNTAEDHASLHFSLDKQYSVIIMEGNSLNQNEFHLNEAKAVAINELSGFPLVTQQDFNQGLIRPNGTVAAMINDLVQIPNLGTVNQAATQPQQGSNYQFNPFNKSLYQLRYSLGVDIRTSMCLPFYETSRNAHTLEELTFAAAQKLAEVQDKAVEFIYRVDGWTQNGFVWQPNMMVTIIEEALSPGTPQSLKMWIKKVVYHKNRTEGTWCEITCTLPYTHNFELTDTPPNQPIPHDDSKIIPMLKLTNIGIGVGVGYDYVVANQGPGAQVGYGVGYDIETEP